MTKKNLFLALSITLIAASCNHNPGMYQGGTVSLVGRTVKVDVAADEATRDLGLGGRSGLTDDQGMWFEFPVADKYSFWMKGMSFPIDIVWVRGNTVVDIAAAVQAQPGVMDANLSTYLPKDAADRVLELSSGWVSRYNLKIGDQVEFLPRH